MKAGHAIETHGLTKKFNGVTAVNHVSFDVKEGEIFGLLGPNGAGKSTTIRVLCTLTRPTGGTAKVGGYDIVKDDSKVRELVGLVSEKMIMYDRLTARENLKFFGKLYNIPNDVLESRIKEMLELVHMEKWQNKQVGTFSTGMKQRINVIRALLNMPKILFMDEPTLGLDPQSSNEIREFVRKLNRERKITIILTTHMMVEADMLCDRIGIMDYGKIVALDTSSNLKKLVSDGNTLELNISNLNGKLLSLIKSVRSVKSVVRENGTRVKVRAKGSGAFDDIVDVIRANNGKIVSINRLEPTLEDVFLHLTGHEVREQVSDKVEAGFRHGHGEGA
ncbi:MAG: ABC transporter ATP-binding protein, partial [Candidatus Hadarchaeum sp.]|nr:ABC transporter ATP-binding protein [Candidatus Hadarchaeum sp.]